MYIPFQGELWWVSEDSDMFTEYVNKIISEKELQVTNLRFDINKGREILKDYKHLFKECKDTVVQLKTSPSWNLLEKCSSLLGERKYYLFCLNNLHDYEVKGGEI